jgi:hypothetical protein
MYNNQLTSSFNTDKEIINTTIVTRKPDFTYDLETILDKLRDKTESLT